MNNPTDTLDIKPLQPFGATPAPEPTPQPTILPVATATDPARDQAAADAARALIAGLPDVHGTVSTDPTPAPAPSATPAPLSLNQSPTPVATAQPTPITSTPVDDSLPMPQPDMLLHPTPTSPLESASEAPADHAPAPKMTTKAKLPSRTKPLALAIGSFVLLFVLFKSPVILSQVKYLSANKNPAPVTNTPAAEVIPPESTLSIPKINVSAPLVFEPSVQEAAVQKALEGGVVHYGDTPAPGQAGNSVIVGHSSNDWWEPGNYKFVFVLLDKLVVGDTFSINYQSKKYVYEVTETKVVEPTDLSVLAPTDTPTVTIITCTPPGTSWKRLIVKAKQTSPNPTASSQTTNSTSSNNASALPGSAPTWLDQLKSIWHNLFGGSKAQSTTTNTNTTAPSLPGAK